MEKYKMTSDVLINPRTGDPFTVVFRDSPLSIFSGFRYETKYGQLTLVGCMLLNWFLITKSLSFNIHKPYQDVINDIYALNNEDTSYEERREYFQSIYNVFYIQKREHLQELHRDLYFQSLQRAYQNTTIKELYLNKEHQLFIDLTTSDIGLSIRLGQIVDIEKTNKELLKDILLLRISEGEPIIGDNVLGAMHRQIAIDLAIRLNNSELKHPFY